MDAKTSISPRAADLECLARRFGRHHRAGRKQDADRVAEQVVAAVMPMIHRLAKPLKRDGLEYDDLLQAGRVAVYEALTRYDINGGAAFVTFVHGALFGQLRIHANRGGWDGNIAEPAYLRELRLRLARVGDHLPMNATTDQIADAARMTTTMIAKLHATEETLRSTVPFGDPDDGCIDPESHPAFGADFRDAIDARVAIEQLLPRLPATYQCIIKRRFFGDETLEEIAASLGCCRENVRTMEARALAKLRLLLEKDL